MVNLSAIRNQSRTFRLDLTTSASSALQITSSSNDQANYVQLLNLGTGTAAVEFSNSSTVADPVIASSGGSGSYTLPPAMNYPVVIACPAEPFYIKGISSGTNTLYITAVQAD